MNIVLFTDVFYYGFGRYAGPYRLATELRRAGFSVVVLEHFNHLQDEEIFKLIDRYVSRETLFVGFSSTFFGVLQLPQEEHSGAIGENYAAKNQLCTGFPQSQATVEKIVQRVRQRNQSAKIVFGGTKAGFQASDQVDYWVTGPADHSVLALAYHLRDGADLKAAPGDGGKSRWIDSSTHYPVTDFSGKDIVWNDSDHISKHEFLPIEIARGCIFRCAFCAYPMNGKNKGDYIKRPEVLYQELINNYERFGVTRYMMCDDTFNDSLKKVESFANVVRRLPFDLEYVCYSRLDTFVRSPQMADLMLESGLRAVQFGIETFDKEAGRAVGKGLPADKAKAILHELKTKWDDEVLTGSGFIIGLPGETEESIRRTFDWLMQDSCPLDFFKFAPLTLHEAAPGLNQSRIDLDTEKFGYQRVGDQWASDILNHERALELSYEFMQASLEKNKIGSFTYARVRNLGLSHEDMMNLTWQKFLADKEKFAAKLDGLRGAYLQRHFGPDSQNLGSGTHSQTSCFGVPHSI